MARRKKKRYRRKNRAVPILPTLAVASPIIQSFNTVGGISTLRSDPSKFIMHMADQLMQRFTGFHLLPEYGTGINTAYLANTYGGLALGIVGHKAASKFGVNRTIKKIPVIGKYIEL